jgi:peptidoglycan/LPS O-acetylase OafA/YrhL
VTAEARWRRAKVLLVVSAVLLGLAIAVASGASWAQPILGWVFEPAVRFWYVGAGILVAGVVLRRNGIGQPAATVMTWVGATWVALAVVLVALVVIAMLVASPFGP